MQGRDINWCQFIIEDEKALSGQSVQDFVTPIIEKLKTKLVVACDLQGAISGLRGCEGVPLSKDDFLQKVVRAIQYDWAFFFLYGQDRMLKPVVCSNVDSAIMDADLTIRLVDDTYFYVYGHRKNITENLFEKYEGFKYKICSFDELDIPY